jgi:hypothetical protein
MQIRPAVELRWRRRSTRAAMMKGLAVGARPAPERRLSSDRRLSPFLRVPVSPLGGRWCCGDGWVGVGVGDRGGGICGGSCLGNAGSKSPLMPPPRPSLLSQPTPCPPPPSPVAAPSPPLCSLLRLAPPPIRLAAGANCRGRCAKDAHRPREVALVCMSDSFTLPTADG